jgi:glycosyltransferase involved in cell wall biosynthesis
VATVANAAAGRPLISVVVPFYDSERHIAACIESLLAQEGVGGPYEVFLVNNGSSDGSADIVARYEGLTLLEEGAPGAYAARNAAIRRARAPLIAFTDADCVADRDWLRSIREGMSDPAVAVLLGPFRYPAPATLALRLLGAYENAKTEYVIDRCAPPYHFGYANNMAVRASVFAELGLFETWRRAADSELVQRLSARRPDLRLAYLPSMRVTHMEFLTARTRARRLSLYTRTNSRISTFRELGLAQRLGVVARMLRRRRAVGAD